MNRIIQLFKGLSSKKRLQLVIALILTISLTVAIPVYAWFANQKKAAELYKIKYPSSLYLNAAHREDRIYFDLDEIDMDEFYMDEDGKPKNFNNDPAGDPDYRKKTHKLYAFSISGEGTTNFTLQLAHTNNNLLTYTVFEATQTKDRPETGEEGFDYVYYERHMGANDNEENPFTFSDDLTVKDAFYEKKGSALALRFCNPDTTDTNGILAVKDVTDKYYKKTYGTTNTNVQINAVPSYWQTNIALTRSDIDSNSKSFHKYYILEVSWNSSQENSKETDLIYLAVKRNS